MTVPEQISPGVYRVDAVGLSNSISVLLIQDDDGWALVDTGVRGSALRIQEALSALGAGPKDLKRIYLTHHHPDHVGGLPAVRWWATEAEVVAPGYEARIISGEHPPDTHSNRVLNVVARRRRLPTEPVDRVAREGDLFAGFRVVSTPGHTNGHTSLLNDRRGLLFTADAFGSLPFKGRRVTIPKGLATDPLGTRLSAEKLLGEEFGTVVFSHGKPLSEEPKRHLGAAVARFSYP